MRSNRILVTSAAGGVGKSSASARLAAALARTGVPVLLVDLGTASRSLDFLAGLSESAVYDLGDLLRSRVEPSRALLAVPDVPGLSLLPGMLSAERSPTVPELLRALTSVEEAVSACFTVLDAPFNVTARRAAAVSDLTYLISDLRRSSLRAAAESAALIPGCDCRLLLNRFPLEHPVAVRPLLDETHLPLAGILPDDPLCPAADEEGRACRAGRDNLSQAYRNIARRLSGKPTPLLSGIRGYRRKTVLKTLVS